MQHYSRLLRARVPAWLVLVAVLPALSIGLLGGFFGATRLSGDCTEPADVCARFTNFWRAWEIASDNFVDPDAVESQRMIDGAISGMLDSLGDQGHTRYLSADAARAWRESLSARFEGIGAYIDVREGQPLIVQPIEGSPAEQAGLRPNDLILKIDGQDVRGITIEELRSRVRGPAGSSVTLTIQHEGEELPFEVTIERREINIPSVTWRMLSEQVALVQLTQFSERSSDQMEQALDELRQQGARAIILDVRNNPGGLVNELIDIASQFLPPDTTVLLEQNRAGERTPYKTEGAGRATDLPLVVLVNNNTASSAEILAGALKEQGRAQVIGVPTFGTATVLRTYSLDDGAQILLGTTQWLTPEGKEVRGVGIEPNEVVALPPEAVPLSPADAAELSLQALREGEDTQLARAVELVQQAARGAEE